MIVVPVPSSHLIGLFFFFQAEDGIRDLTVTGVQTCALPISSDGSASFSFDGAGSFTAHVTSASDGPLHVLVTRFSDAVQQQAIFYVPTVQPGEQLTLPFAGDSELAQLRLQTPDGQLAPTATL